MIRHKYVAIKRNENTLSVWSITCVTAMLIVACSLILVDVNTQLKRLDQAEDYGKISKVQYAKLILLAMRRGLIIAAIATVGIILSPNFHNI